MINSPVDEIKNRLDILEVIGSYIKLHKAGASYRALCPFHSEKKPSFFVSPARQIWHCFGCNTGHNIFDFVMKIEGVEFGDALRILAQRAGVELKPISRELRTERQRLYEICELSCRFFEKQLQASKIGESVKKYLSDRGIKEELIKKWRLGYSPDSWQGLSDFLVAKAYQREEIIKAGLAVKREENIRENSLEIREDLRDSYDRFRGRIMFPIFDLNSQVIGFGGRIFGKKETQEIAKYINTPNTLLYDKSRVLYGLDKAKVEIRKKDFCILVEGYTDVIMCHQAGSSNVVATSGTALTPYQLKVLKRYSENILTAFDMDVAGGSATKRGIDLAQALGFNIKIITLPENSDPAEIIFKNPKDWERFLKDAKSILDFYFETTFASFDAKTPEGKKSISKILLPIIKRIPNHIEKSFWVQELTKRLEVKEEDVVKELKKAKLPEEIFIAEKDEVVTLPQKSRRELLEERMATLILKDSENFNLITKKDWALFSPQMYQVISNFKGSASPDKLNPELTSLINYLSLKAEIEEESVDAREEFENCLKEIKRLDIKDKLDKISRNIKMAEEKKDSTELEKLIQEFNQCSKLLNELA